MTLQEIEQAIQERIEHMALMDDYVIDAWLEAYRTLAQVKQAIDTERIATALENLVSVLPRD